MTLGEFFTHCSQNPNTLLTFFSVLPLTALVVWFIAKNEGDISPWKYLYSGLVYLSCIPGIFSVVLSIYLFFFERGSIMQANIYTQILPILSMILTLWLIRRNVDFDRIPGFDKIGNLIFFLGILIILLWFMEKANIIIFSYLPFYQFILIFVVGIIVLRFLLSRVFG